MNKVRDRRLVRQRKYSHINVKTTRCGLTGFEFDVSNTAQIYFELKYRRPIDKTLCVFSFDYICPDYIVFFRIAVGDRSFFIRNVDPAVRWKSFCIDLSPCKDSLQDFLSRPFNIFKIRLDVVPFPTAPQTSFKMRNVRLRSYTAHEKRKIEYREKCLQGDSPSIDLENYYTGRIFPSIITSVSGRENDIRIEGSVADVGMDAYLCEIPMFRSLSNDNLCIVKKIESQDGTFTAVVDRRTDTYGKTYDRILSRWFIAYKYPSEYKICSYGKYAETVESRHVFPPVFPRTKKGIGAFHKTPFESDLDELGISYTTINIYINDYIRLKPVRGSLPFEYNGTVYHIIEKEIRAYDELILAAARRNIIVSAILLVRTEQQSPDKEVGLMLEYPESDRAGAYSMPNTTTDDSLHLYAAAVDFLAQRYNRPDRKYGRIHYWIAHNEVDAGGVWTNAGDKTLREYMDIFMKSLRLIYYTVRKYDGNAEVLVSLTHFWHAKHGERNCYPSAQLMELLLECCRIEGDFHWGIAHHPYPEDLLEPKSWLDANATFSLGTAYITFKNLEVLDEWIRSSRMLYRGQKRTLLLSEQNPNTIDYTTESLNEQAACLAYAMKKVNALSGIDAYIAHSWHDEYFEGGLKTGLRKYPDDPEDPYGKKRSWFVFRDAETEREDGTFEFAKALIGIEEWNEIFQAVEMSEE